jgi:hypothetical protein
MSRVHRAEMKRRSSGANSKFNFLNSNLFGIGGRASIRCVKYSARWVCDPSRCSWRLRVSSFRVSSYGWR